MPTSITEIKPEGRFFGMLAARSSSGKTSVSLTFPKPLLYIDFDLRIRGGLWTKEIMPPEEFSQIDVESYPPSRGFQDFYNMLDKWEIELMSKAFKYKTIVIGSITNTSRVFQKEVQELTGGRIIGGKQVGDKIKGGIRVSGPADHNIKDQAIYHVFDLIRSFPINVICEAHIVDRYGRPQNADPKEIVPEQKIGEKLTLTSNLGENILTYFDEVYVIEKEDIGGSIDYYARFVSDIARSTFHPLTKMKRMNITGRNFYKEWLKAIKDGQ